jgi:hypothetical protein
MAQRAHAKRGDDRRRRRSTDTSRTFRRCANSHGKQEFLHIMYKHHVDPNGHFYLNAVGDDVGRGSIGQSTPGKQISRENELVPGVIPPGAVLIVLPHLSTFIERSHVRQALYLSNKTCEQGRGVVPSPH